MNTQFQLAQNLTCVGPPGIYALPTSRSDCSPSPDTQWHLPSPNSILVITIIPKDEENPTANHLPISRVCHVALTDYRL